MDLFIVFARVSDGWLYAGEDDEGRSRFVNNIACARVFFTDSEDPMTKYKIAAKDLGCTILRYSYKPYKEHVTGLGIEPIKLECDRSITFKWYPHGSPSFQYPHAVCLKCGAYVVGDRGAKPKRCSKCGSEFK